MIANPPSSVLELIAFPGAPNLPIFVALEQRMFETSGTQLKLETTPSSAYQMEKLLAGERDIAATAFDNVVAYQEGQGAVTVATQPDLFVFMGATQIELSLVVAPDVERHQDLRGRSIALDALSTGFAFVLYRMLERGGLQTDDYRMVAVGATPQRWESVRSGKHAATLTIEPFTSIALAQGFRVLETSIEAFDHYQGGIFAARRSWAEANAERLVAFVRGYLQGLEWTLAPENRDAAVQTLLRNMPAIKPGVVDLVMKKLLSPRTGLSPGGRLDRDGINTVLELRSHYGEPRKRLNDPEKYLDLSYYRRAIAST